MTNKTIYIRDDLGHAWYYANGKIRCVLAELEPVELPYEENGYDCDNLEDGIKYLNETGYITGEDYPS